MSKDNQVELIRLLALLSIPATIVGNVLVDENVKIEDILSSENVKFLEAVPTTKQLREAYATHLDCMSKMKKAYDEKVALPSALELLIMMYKDKLNGTTSWDDAMSKGLAQAQAQES